MMHNKKDKLDILERNLWIAARMANELAYQDKDKDVTFNARKIMRTIKAHHKEQLKMKYPLQNEIIAWRIVTIAAAISLIVVSFANFVVSEKNLSWLSFVYYDDDYDINALLR